MKLTKESLIDYLCNKNTKEYKENIGLELEMFLCNISSLTPLNKEEVCKILKLFSIDKWQRCYENNTLNSLKSSIGSITLEPGFQLELSSSVENNINNLFIKYQEFLKDLSYALRNNGFSALSIGHHPFLTPEAIPFNNTPKYDFMYKYMPKVGSLGRNMMKTTTSLQINIDYSDEEDLKKKVQVISNITPFLIYFSASSPFNEGKITNYLSYRNHIWEHTDPARVSIPDFYFNNKFTIEKYIDYVINIPFYYIIKNNKYYFNYNGHTFLDLMNNKIPGIYANLEDFITHLSSIYSDIRIKKYLEIRCCDNMGFSYYVTIPSLLVGLLYHKNTLETVYQLTKNWTKKTHIELKKHLNTKGLTKEFIREVDLNSFSNTLLDLAYEGLIKRNLNEEIYLQPLKQIIQNKSNIAQKYIESFKKYNNDILLFTKSIMHM